MSADTPGAVDAPRNGAAPVESVTSQELFREVNERTAERGGPLGTLDVFCECVPGCLERIELPPDEYDAVRRFPTRFLVKAAHVTPTCERVIDVADSYVVVEKTEPAAAAAIRMDPRRADGAGASPAQPRLLFFTSPTSGPCRRMESFIAQVLQRRRNHDTFEFVQIDVTRSPSVAATYRIDRPPALIVVENGQVSGRLDGPHGATEIAETLRPWLR